MEVFYKIGVVFGIFIVYMAFTLVIGALVAVLLDSAGELEALFFGAWVVGTVVFFALALYTLKLLNLWV